MKLRLYATLLALPGFILLSSASLLAADADERNFDGEIEVGYRAVSTDGNPDRAAEYSFLESSPTLDIEARGGSGTEHFIFEGHYLNENDYRAEANYDYGGLVRFDLRSERFFHNLDHIPYDPSLAEARQNAFIDPDPLVAGDEILRVLYGDDDPGEDYGIRLDTNEARFRGKFKNYPAHLNLRYWRYEKKGDQQLRFVDEGFDSNNDGSCTACHMQSKTRGIDRVTNEFTAGVDAHVGPVDIIVEQLYREFREREAIPVDTFSGHSLRASDSTDVYQHDEVPDSRLTETTFKIHSSLSGGVIGAGSFTIGERENRSDLAGNPYGVSGVTAETDYYKASGDLTYIPSPKWTLNFRYRFLDLDADNPQQVSAYDRDIDVRESVDLRRSSHEAKIVYRPSRKLTLKADYQLENLHRGNTGGALQHHGFTLTDADPDNDEIDLVWELPEEEVLQRVKVGLLARPLGSRSLKLNLWYQYRTSDDPAYGASFENRHEFFFGSTFSPSSFWGINLTAKALIDENDRHKEYLFENDSDILVELDREREQQDFGLGIWVNPLSRLSTGINYGFMRSRIQQDLLFGSDLGDPDAVANHVILDELVEYSQRVHTLSVNASLQWTEELILRLDGYHIRSLAEFSPNFNVLADIDGISLGFPASSDDLRELSRIDIRQNGLSAGLDWKPSSAWTYSLRYTYDDYEDRDESVFDGTAQTYIASVSRIW